MTTTAAKIDALTDLKSRPQWVVYCLEPDKNDATRLTKVPYNANTGYKASSTNPKNWATYAQAVRAFNNAKNVDDKPFDGIGFVFNRDMTGIDCDHCRDANGNIDPWAQEVIDALGSYAEISISEEGIHIFVFGLVPLNEKGKHAGRKKGLPGMRHPKAAIEMYSEGRFFTVSEKHLPGTPSAIEDRQEQLTAIHARFYAPKQQEGKHASRRAADALSLSDNELLDIAHRAKNGAKFSALWRGDYSGYTSQSEADQALCDMLAFYTGKDKARMQYMFERSGLHRNKWDTHPTYASDTLDKAIAQCRDVYAPRSANGRVLHTSSNGHKGNNGGSAPTTTSGDSYLCDFTPDDAGNGDAMLALFGDDFLYCSSRGWFAHTGTHWQLDPDAAEVKKKAVETLRKRRHAAVDAGMEAIIKCTKGDEGRVNGCVSRFKTLVSVNFDTFDSNPDVLNCQNGVVDLRTGKLEEHKRTHRFTYCLPVDYVEGANYSEWMNYLRGVVSEEILDYLQELAGYSLTGHTREEILLYLNGPTRSGKGTFAETFMALLPSPLSTMVDFNSFTAKREGDVSNFDLAPLKPARMIFASESNRSQSLNPAKIKQLTGGDRIRACFKHKDFFEYRPQFKVWMMSNHPVHGDPEDDALWGRVRVIEFPHSFLGKEDKTKKSRLKEPEMLKGVLYWAVQGAIRWYALGANGLSTPAAIAKTTQAQRNELDYVQQWLDECCEENEGGWVANEEVISSYTTWCKNHNVEYVKSPQALSQSLKVKGYIIGKQKKINGKNKKGVENLFIYPIEEEEEEGNGNDGND